MLTVELKEADVSFLMPQQHDKINERCVWRCKVVAFSKLASFSAVTGFALEKGEQEERHTNEERGHSGG